MNFAYPWALILVPLALSIAGLRRPRPASAPFSSIALLKDLPTSWRQRLRTPLLGLLSILCLVCLAIAAARPQKVTTVKQPEAARNLVLALDISRSMATRDFYSGVLPLTRLAAVKQVVQEFVKHRRGDRIGLVVFGTNAFLQSPLTTDHVLIEQLISYLRVGIAGDGTAIGDGLGVSLKRLSDVEADSKAVILLTDGASNSGTANPLQAARVAADLGIKVHTIGIGSERTQQFNMFGVAGTMAEYDEETLREIASITDGVFFNASNLEGLKDVYRQIDELERTERDELEKRIVEEHFWPYALIALLCYAAYLILARSVFMVVP